MLIALFVLSLLAGGTIFIGVTGWLAVIYIPAWLLLSTLLLVGYERLTDCSS